MRHFSHLVQEDSVLSFSPHLFGSHPFLDIFVPTLFLRTRPPLLTCRVVLTSRGACINGMGRHWEYDLATAPVQVRTRSTSLFQPTSSHISTLNQSRGMSLISSPSFRCTTTAATSTPSSSLLPSFNSLSLATICGVRLSLCV